jgi:hypothetical protein
VTWKPDRHEARAVEHRLETPRAAGIAGLVFSVLFVVAVLLLRVRHQSGIERAGDRGLLDLGARRFEPCRGKTLILVDVIDQSHLHGVLGWLQDHNIEIERVNPI